MAALSENLESVSNPIDLVEELVSAHQWNFDRFDQDEMIVDAKGKWSTYRLYFLWREDLNALYFSAGLAETVSNECLPQMYELLAHANEKLWMGHFEISHDEMTPMFRQTCLMRGQWEASSEQIEDLVEIAISEWDRFYPAFQQVINGGRQADEALLLSMVDVAGMA